MRTPYIEIDDALCTGPYSLSMPYPGLFFFESSKTSRYILLPYAIDEVISEDAAMFASYENGLLIFERGEPETYPLLYELTKRLAQDAPNELLRAYYQEELEQLRSVGQLEMPVYFGLSPLPTKTPLGPVEDVQRIFNGACFTRTGNRWLLCIAELAQSITREHLLGIGAILLDNHIFFDFEPWSPQVRRAAAQELELAPLFKHPIDPALDELFPLYAQVMSLWREC